jgi:MipA family protein
MRGVGLLLAGMVGLWSSAADGQEIETEDVFDGDYMIVGVGAGWLPSYEGSDDSRIVPLIGAVGELGGIGIGIRGPRLALDLVPDRAGRPVNFNLGPQVLYRANRKGNVKDEVVERLGSLKATVEVGFRAGMSFRGLVAKQDRVSVGVSTRWDVTGNSDGMVVAPSMSYLVPVSRAQVFGLRVAAEIVDDDHADYYFGITPAGSAASGLPVFDAKGGFKEASIGLATARDLNGNFLDGGFSIAAGVMYTRLFGSAARSPITSIRGSRNQWSVGAGLAYTF